MPRTKKSIQSAKLGFILRNAAAFIPLLMIPFGLLARQDFFESQFYAGDSYLFIIAGMYGIVSALYLWHKLKRPPSLIADLAFITFCHFMCFMYFTFVSGFLSTFLSVWIILMISADMRFGQKGFAASFLGLSLAGAISIVAHPETPANQLVEIVQGTLVVGAIGYVIARIRATTDKERVALAKTRELEIYQRERLLALVNSMGDAVVATDEDGIIKVYNSTLLSLLDTNMNLEGKQIDDVLKLSDPNKKRVKIVKEAQNRHSVFSRTDLAHKFADGETIKLYINVAPIQPGYRSHAERGFIFILRNITKEKTLEEERDEFISVVSHELRTPVTIAEGNLSNIKLLFERGAASQVITKAVDDAHEQIIYLAKLVNDLGTLARAERTTGNQTELVDIKTLLHDIYNTYAPQAEAKKLQFNLDAQPTLPNVVTNRLYLQEILQNLITNAIKYTQKGGVTLRAKQSKSDLFFEIQDTGIGISKSDQPHIFEKFYRSEDYRTRESNGTGLGLYVCKKLSEKLGYKISFTSRLNHGTTFSLTIPLQTDKLT